MCVCVHVCTYVCACVYVCVCMCVCMCVYCAHIGPMLSPVISSTINRVSILCSSCYGNKQQARCHRDPLNTLQYSTLARHYTNSFVAQLLHSNSQDGPWGVYLDVDSLDLDVHWQCMLTAEEPGKSHNKMEDGHCIF